MVIVPRCRGGARPAARARLPPDRRDQSAGHRARAADARAGRRDEYVSARASCRSMRSKCARMTTPTIATAASRSPACCCVPRSATASRSMRASWSATAGATSRRDDSAGCRTILIGDGYGETVQGAAGCDVSHADRSRRLDSQATRESQGLIMPTVEPTQGQDFCRRRRQGRHAGDVQAIRTSRASPPIRR